MLTVCGCWRIISSNARSTLWRARRRATQRPTNLSDDFTIRQICRHDYMSFDGVTRVRDAPIPAVPVAHVMAGDGGDTTSEHVESTPPATIDCSRGLRPDTE